MKYDMNDSFDYKRQISCMTLRLLEFFIWILYLAENKKERKTENSLLLTSYKSEGNKMFSDIWKVHS